MTVSDHGFHRPQSTAALPEAGLQVTLEAKPEERAKIAAFLGVLEIGTLRAHLTLRRWRAHGLHLSGTVRADVTQSCVVTLKPVASTVNTAIDYKFLPASMLDAQTEVHELILDPMGEDPPEPLEPVLDLGDLTISELALALDPYPRAPDAGKPETPESSEQPNPFAVLKDLTRRE